ncbi:protein CC2D2B isoform X3 [Ascaphus truei]|uniref:protein CC2D2B isoform X3 n=1 Tax=Ascaphus truei TaxID=8439 RepID=UPI003F5A8C01
MENNCNKEETSANVRKEETQEQITKKKLSSKRKSIQRKLSEVSEHGTAVHWPDVTLDTNQDDALVVLLQGEAVLQNQGRLAEPFRGRKRETFHAEKEKAAAEEALLFFIGPKDERPELEEGSSVQNVDQMLSTDSFHSATDKKDQITTTGNKVEEIEPYLFRETSVEYENVEERRQKAKQCLFVPSSLPVFHRYKMPPNMEPRLMEDEGLYVEQRLELSKKTIRKMENRLIQENDGISWFGADGEIKSLPSPIKQPWAIRTPLPHYKFQPALQAVYKKALQFEQESSIINAVEGKKELFQLELIISSVLFKHHHLFTEEHVLASDLYQLYENFQFRQQQNITQALCEKLNALIHCVKAAEGNAEADQKHRKRLDDYKSQIRETKRLHDVEVNNDISVIHKILTVWKQIKAVRIKQGFTSTSVKIQFQKMTVKNNQENQEHELQMSNTELNEKQSKTTEVFHEVAENWKEKEQMTRGDIGCAEEQESVKQGSQRQPGNPVLIPWLTMTAEITPFSSCPVHERIRRSKIGKLVYFIKMFYNGKYVFCTEFFHLELDFRVEFQLAASIQVVHLPESICLEIHEATLKDKSMLAKVYLPVPHTTLLKGKDAFEEVQFGSDRTVMPEHSEVGCNVPFSLNKCGLNKICLLTSGKLTYSLCWAKDDNGVPLAPAASQFKCLSKNLQMKLPFPFSGGVSRFSSSGSLLEWAKDITIDPNDPRYSDIAHLIQYAKDKEQTVPGYFRLEQLQEEFDFVTEGEMKQSKRFQLLMLRNAGQLAVTKENKPIPSYDDEILHSQLQESEHQKAKKKLEVEKDPITAQRVNSATIISKMRNLLLKKLLKVKPRKKLSDMVNEYEEVTSISQLSRAIFQIAETKRHLKPHRKERVKVPARRLKDGDINILVRISRAYNIPVRISETARPGSASSCSISQDSCRPVSKSIQTPDAVKEVNVQPFVEVSFQNAVYQTSTANGSHPCWNEELQLMFKSPKGDYSFPGLSKVQDKIYIKLYDEAMIEKHEDTCHRGCGTHSFVRNNWLGCIEFPFTSLLHHTKISGTFPVNMPPALLGYTRCNINGFVNEEMKDQDQTEQSFLNIFATIEPDISHVGHEFQKDNKVNPLWMIADHYEDEQLLQTAYNFIRFCNALFPTRRVITMVSDMEGNGVLVTSYIKALNPPEELLNMFPGHIQSTCFIIARFVSLIPCLSDILEINEADDNVCDCWMTSEGSVAYVLSLEGVEYILWNPMNGQCYKQFDTFCPLQRIDCLIGEENVWFNLQTHNETMSVDVDVSKEMLWKPLFSKSFQPREFPTEQKTNLNYLPTDQDMVEELKKSIERALKNKLIEWRPKQMTFWNRQCTAILRAILPKLEFNYARIAAEEEKALKRLHKVYNVAGYPIQLPYSSIQSVTEAVYQTGFHTTEIPNTEFCIAVYIHPYPNNILSVWIYLASLVRRH